MEKYRKKTGTKVSEFDAGGDAMVLAVKRGKDKRRWLLWETENS